MVDISVEAGRFKQEQAFPRVSLLKDESDSSPEETQAALDSCLFWRWPVAVAVGAGSV